MRRLQVSIPTAHVTVLEQEAARRGFTVSGFVRYLVLNHLNTRQKGGSTS